MVLPTVLLLFAGASFAQSDASLPEKVHFNRDVRPILSDNCFYCHGPDANHREADLRLDVREEALDSAAFVPGKPAESTLVERILADDPEQRMPPPGSHKELTNRQKEILQLWIAQGAEYQRHWAYEPPAKADVPAGQNAVDVLVARRLAEIGLQPSPEADRRTLIRRLSWDLIGLPPTHEEVAAFENDSSPNAYENLVDRLLQNPHYGERMAITWLDIVRFADTIGYHSDNPRNVWPYRDWVIQSFNDNKPFDRFTIEQIAGDLLPDANQQTRVGSAFNRLLLTTEEGGAQPKDYEARMVADRVRDWHGVVGSDDRLCAVPRSQIRPVHHAGFLLAGCVLRRHPGAHSRPARRWHDRRHTRAGAAVGEVGCSSHGRSQGIRGHCAAARRGAETVGSGRRGLRRDAARTAAGFAGR